MPAKHLIQAAIRKGSNPWAIAQAMVNRGQISPAQREHVVYKVTRSVLGRKGRWKK